MIYETKLGAAYNIVQNSNMYQEVTMKKVFLTLSSHYLTFLNISSGTSQSSDYI